MKLSTQLAYNKSLKETAAEAVRLEEAGIDLVWVAEAYGFDAVSLMGYLAAVTERVEIASGILPVYTRTPTLLAMTAAGVD
ncbi:LLM class F420-dependent oxidoreductase, partial [cyanobacterium TDX16]